MIERIEKLSIEPGDLLIVKTPEDMQTLIEMVQAGIGFSQYSNPVLYLPGGLEKANEQELLEALSIVQKMNRIATDIITRVN